MLNPVYETVIDELAIHDYAIVDGFITEHILEGLFSQILFQDEQENLRLAGIGTGADFDKDKTIRSDKIKWINDESKHPSEQDFLTTMEDFSAYLNRTCYSGIQGKEFHYAIYESGTFYKRHLDQFKLDDSRKFSVITYLNKNWVPEDAGQLRLFLDNKEIDIEPIWGRTVFLRSDVIEHEVCLSKNKRLSVTGWLR